MAHEEDAFVTASGSDGQAEDVRLEDQCGHFHTPMESLSLCSSLSGVEGAATTTNLSSSPYFSPRIQSLIERRIDFDSEVEFDIESSKSHWTELSVSASDSDVDEPVRERNRVAFEKLKEHAEWGPFFRRQRYDLVIGEKIAEGGQADIFNAILRNRGPYVPDGRKEQLVVKVFREGFPLQDLQRLWPPGLATAAFPSRYFPPARGSYGLCWAVDAQLLEDGRFAFVYDKYYSDLRKCIDKRKLKSNGTRPFAWDETLEIVINIAKGMAALHKFGLLHKDLKAANVLVCINGGHFAAFITDFESSVGIVGTGFWRAPEVLLALKNRSLKAETFTAQTDVYSYAMTCYEVVTGRVPFEGHPLSDFDIVLGRDERPALPDDIFPEFKALVEKCWHKDPLQRPSFADILGHLREISASYHFPAYVSGTSLIGPKASDEEPQHGALVLDRVLLSSHRRGGGAQHFQA